MHKQAEDKPPTSNGAQSHSPFTQAPPVQNGMPDGPMHTETTHKQSKHRANASASSSGSSQDAQEVGSPSLIAGLGLGARSFDTYHHSE